MVIRNFNAQPVVNKQGGGGGGIFFHVFNVFIIMLIIPSFKKGVIVEQFQGNKQIDKTTITKNRKPVVCVLRS